MEKLKIARIINRTDEDPNASDPIRPYSNYELVLEDGTVVTQHTSSNDSFAVNDLTVNFDGNFKKIVEAGIDRIMFRDRVVYEKWMAPQLLKCEGGLQRCYLRYMLCKNY